MITPGKVSTALHLSLCDHGCIYICSSWDEGKEAVSMLLRCLMTLHLAELEPELLLYSYTPTASLRAATIILD